MHLRVLSFVLDILTNMSGAQNVNNLYLQNLCEPQAYVPMLHSEHSKEVGLYRSRTCNTKRNCKRKIDINITPQKLIFSSL